MLFARRTDRAIEQLHRTLDIDPDFPNAHLFLGMCHEQQGRHREALEEIEKVRSLSGGNLLMIGSLGHAYGSAGMRPEAEAVVTEMAEPRKERYVAALDFAYVHSGLRDKEKALEWLEQAYRERSAWLIWIAADARFSSLLRRLNLAA